MHKHLKLTLAAMTLFVGTFAKTSVSHALEQPTADAKVESTSGQAVALSDYRGKPTIVFYEDRYSGDTNRVLKDQLSEQRSQGDKVNVVGVANLKAMDKFPMKGFAIGKVKKLAEKAGVPIH